MRLAAPLFVSAFLLLLTFGPRARGEADAGGERVYADEHGVIRWRADQREVALFGANYSLASACDYRAAGSVGADRKRLVDQDLAHFNRMGWDGIRLCFWGDWENSDPEGNLLPNDHLDLLDYAIAVATKRGLGILFTPITTYSSLWPDGRDNPEIRGFSKAFPKDQLGRNPAAIAAQRRYLRQILEHVNPYTGRALKDEPAILFIEMINEPTHHSADLAGSIAYINALAEAVRSTGCRKLLFHNLSQDFEIAPAIKASTVPGMTFAWYPTGLNANHALEGSYLRTVDDYAPMARPELRDAPKLVYEFDSADLNTGYMYPAMVRALRGAGAQFMAMFSYDMLATAPYNLGWQTHFLNLVYSPRKALSAVIAAEAARVLPRYSRWGDYPANCHFGPFRVSAEEDSSEMVTAEQFLYANDTATVPPDPAALRRVAGCGSSAVVQYEGTGTYFLDRVKPGVWRLELYPDVVQVRDPFARRIDDRSPSIQLVSRATAMTVKLPDLGEEFTVEPLNPGNRHSAWARRGEFVARPGAFLLARGPVDRASLPATVAGVALTEFVCPDVPEPSVPLPTSSSRDFGMVNADEASAGRPEVWFLPGRDAGRLAYTRIGDGIRHGISQLLAETPTEPAALRLFLPLSKDGSLDDYTASLPVKTQLQGRGVGERGRAVLRVKARGAREGLRLHVTLVERDGTAWGTAVSLGLGWREADLPVAELAVTRGVLLPLGYPGRWNYWVTPALHRGGQGDRPHLRDVEHLQFSLRPTRPAAAQDEWADIASVTLVDQP
jgi:hypothetical protein